MTVACGGSFDPGPSSSAAAAGGDPTGAEGGCDGVGDRAQCEVRGPACLFEPGAFYDVEPETGCTPAAGALGFCGTEGAQDLSDACYVNADGTRVACFEVTVAAPPGWFLCGTEDPPWCDGAAPSCCCTVLP